MPKISKYVAYLGKATLIVLFIVNLTDNCQNIYILSIYMFLNLSFINLSFNFSIIVDINSFISSKR